MHKSIWNQYSISNEYCIKYKWVRPRVQSLTNLLICIYYSMYCCSFCCPQTTNNNIFRLKMECNGIIMNMNWIRGVNEEDNKVKNGNIIVMKLMRPFQLVHNALPECLGTWCIHNHKGQWNTQREIWIIIISKQLDVNRDASKRIYQAMHLSIFLYLVR